MSVSDCTAALAAGWERVRRTMPDTEEKDVVRPDLLAITHFLGLIKGRLQVPIPKTWEKALKSAQGYGPRRIWFEGSERMKDEWLLQWDDPHVLVKKGRQSIKLPAEAVLEPASHVTVERAGKWAYVAVYSSLPDSDYKLFAIEEASGKVIWSSHVWGTSRVNPPGVLMGYSGHDWHVASMRLTGEMLVVFGFSSGAVYVEAFDRETGKNRCRFSTAYFERVSPRK
jgi:outer membrane protein assembly factor BamB